MTRSVGRSQYGLPPVPNYLHARRGRPIELEEIHVLKAELQELRKERNPEGSRAERFRKLNCIEFSQLFATFCYRIICAVSMVL